MSGDHSLVKELEKELFYLTQETIGAPLDIRAFDYNRGKHAGIRLALDLLIAQLKREAAGMED